MAFLHRNHHVFRVDDGLNGKQTKIAFHFMAANLTIKNTSILILILISTTESEEHPSSDENQCSVNKSQDQQWHRFPSIKRRNFKFHPQTLSTSATSQSSQFVSLLNAAAFIINHFCPLRLSSDCKLCCPLIAFGETFKTYISWKKECYSRGCGIIINNKTRQIAGFMTKTFTTCYFSTKHTSIYIGNLCVLSRGEVLNGILGPRWKFIHRHLIDKWVSIQFYTLPLKW